MKAVKCNDGDLHTVCLDTGLRTGIMGTYGIEVAAEYVKDGDVKLHVYEVSYSEPGLPSNPCRKGYFRPPMVSHRTKQMTGWNVWLAAPLQSPQEIMSERRDFALDAADNYISYAKGRKIDYENLDSFREKLVGSLERCIVELVAIDIL